MTERIFEVEISNKTPKGYETATTLEMPATWAEFHDALEKARIKDARDCCNELTRIEYPGIQRGMIGDNVNLYELNLLAQRLAMLSEDDRMGLDGLLQIEGRQHIGPIPLPRLINLTYNTDICTLAPHVFTVQELGALLYESEVLPKEAIALLDTTELGSSFQNALLKVFGQKHQEDFDGVFTSRGYADLEQIGFRYEEQHPGVFIGDCFVVLPSRAPKQIYDGTNLDKVWEMDWSLRLRLATPAVPKGVWLCLPDHAATEADGRLGEIALALRELKAASIQECDLLEVRCSIPGLSILPDDYEDLEDLIRDGNDLGFLLEEQGQGMPDFMERFTAALEYEGCHRLKEALDIAENLNCYDLMQADGIELYGKEELTKLGVFQDSTLQDCIDAAGFGEALLEQRGYRLNAAETTYIRRNDREFQHLRTQPKQGWDMTMK